VIRAVLAGSSTAGQNVNLLVAEESILGIGFFSLLFSAYTLVLDLYVGIISSSAATNSWFSRFSILLSDYPTKSRILRFTQNRRAFKIVLIVAVALGIAASSTFDASPNASNTSSSLRKASTIIFLVLTALQAIQTIYLAKIQMSREPNHQSV